MSQKNDTTVLFLALFITLASAAVGFWWFTKNPSSNTTGNDPNSSTNSSQTFNPNSNLPEQVSNFRSVQNVPSGLVSYGGSTTWAPLRKLADSVIQEVWPEFKLRYTQHPTKSPGSTTGIEMLLNDQLAFSQSSRPITETEYQQAKEKNFTLKQIPVAIDGIAVAVNWELDIPGLTIAQLKDIYTGKITNWYEVGGPYLPIIPYSRRLGESGTKELLVENILNGEKMGDNVVFLPKSTDALRQVSEDVAAIYYASATKIVPQCKVKALPIGRDSAQLIAPYQEPLVPPENCPAERNQLNYAAFESGDYPITRRLFVIVKENGQIDQQAGEAYARLLLTNQGQTKVEKAGFVRIR